MCLLLDAIHTTITTLRDDFRLFAHCVDVYIILQSPIPAVL